jgi:hypothetical protein
VVVPEPARQVAQQPLRSRGVAGTVGLVDGLSHRWAHVLGQVVEDVARLVGLAPLDHRARPEDLADRIGQRLRSVEHHQGGPIRPETWGRSNFATRTMTWRSSGVAAKGARIVGVESSKEAALGAISANRATRSHSRHPPAKFAELPSAFVSLGAHHLGNFPHLAFVLASLPLGEALERMSVSLLGGFAFAPQALALAFLEVGHAPFSVESANPFGLDLELRHDLAQILAGIE